MAIFLHFAYAWLLIVLLPIVGALVIYRVRYYKPIYYRHSLVGMLKRAVLHTGIIRVKVFFILRTVILLLLALLTAKPQFTDTRSKMPVNGIDIMLVLDVSGSMNCFDDINDRRLRIEVAKKEAQRFIDKRENDAIGLVLFAADAISRVPLTMDKKLLTQIIDEIQLGMIDHRATMLGKGMVLAANRLRSSQTKSKIMILLTDGQPTQDDIDHEQAITIARNFGIKIYTIGIGNQEGGYGMHPYFRTVMRVPVTLNKQLLEKIASETGGKFFEAKKPKDMQRIYDEIDRLEKTEHDTDIYHRYRDFFMPFLLAALVLVLAELVLSFVWFGL